MNVAKGKSIYNLVKPESRHIGTRRFLGERLGDFRDDRPGLVEQPDSGYFGPVTLDYDPQGGRSAPSDAA